ncbi:aspartate alpha-decarboxylase [Enterococcus hirae]|nr:aspartate alpha-decarboxylase [Enterococcus hirae]
MELQLDVVSTGDKIILMAYCELNENEVKDHRPKVVFVDDNNKVERVTSYEKHGKVIRYNSLGFVMLFIYS